jgi:hypothetical protein
MKANVWEIVRKEDGSLDIFHREILLHGSVPDKWLEDQLVDHGLCGQEYQDIRRQLDQFGRAQIVL